MISCVMLGLHSASYTFILLNRKEEEKEEEEHVSIDQLLYGLKLEKVTPIHFLLIKGQLFKKHPT